MTMTQFHPDIHWLTDFAAGNLPLSQALCVSTHLSYCDHCTSELEQLDTVGAALINGEHIDAQSTPISVGLEEKIMALIDSDEHAALQPSAKSTRETDTSSPTQMKSQVKLPNSLSPLLPVGGSDQLNWKRLSTSLSVARLPAGDPEREIALHKIKAGGSVADHDHCGREITVVLTGSFSDQNGLYLPGDFLVKEPGQAHRPIASDDTECVCLSVMDAPVKFTGVVARLVNPFLRIKPMSA